jgi:diguanylate cyclase (GGDEF)-like protein
VRPMITSLGLAINAAYLFAAAFSLWCGRAERLPARWPIIFFLVMHATILAIGTYSTLAVSDVLDQIPPLMSFFGIIHFESTIFSVGTAVFLLALFKERSEAATRTAANIDSLTGIANRAAFLEAADRLMERCRRDSAPVSVIMFDLDRFKSVNDLYGHAVGDAVIQKFCEVTAAALRPSDVFGRLGGEEFAMALPQCSIEPAYIRAERIRTTFADACRIVGNHQVNATVSGGVAVTVNAGTTLSELLKYSDEALYLSKRTGRNRIRRADQLEREGGISAVIRVA